jgi:hypothetical protein
MKPSDSIRTFGVGLALSLLASVAGATPATDGATQPTRVKAPEVGETTRAALAIQRSGSQAGEAVLLRGEEAALGHKRYLDSFTHPLPPQFGSATGSGRGGIASGSGAVRQ